MFFTSTTPPFSQYHPRYKTVEDVLNGDHRMVVAEFDVNHTGDDEEEDRIAMEYRRRYEEALRTQDDIQSAEEHAAMKQRLKLEQKKQKQDKTDKTETPQQQGEEEAKKPQKDDKKHKKEKPKKEKEEAKKPKHKQDKGSKKKK